MSAIVWIALGLAAWTAGSVATGILLGAAFRRGSWGFGAPRRPAAPALELPPAPPRRRAA